MPELYCEDPAYCLALVGMMVGGHPQWLAPATSTRRRRKRRAACLSRLQFRARISNYAVIVCGSRKGWLRPKASPDVRDAWPGIDWTRLARGCPCATLAHRSAVEQRSVPEEHFVLPGSGIGRCYWIGDFRVGSKRITLIATGISSRLPSFWLHTAPRRLFD